jgi:hypothetical protein
MARRDRLIFASKKTLVAGSLPARERAAGVIGKISALSSTDELVWAICSRT